MAWTLDGKYQSVSEDRIIILERTSDGLEVKVKKLSDNSLLGKITIPLADLPGFRAMTTSCCSLA